MPIELIADLPEGVVGFAAKGKVTAEDYEQVLVPAVDAALADRDRLRILYVLGDEYEGYSGAAAWEDTKLGMHHLSAWEKCAVVTDHEGLAHAVAAFGYLIPAKVKTFGTAEEADARAWVAA